MILGRADEPPDKVVRLSRFDDSFEAQLKKEKRETSNKTTNFSHRPSHSTHAHTHNHNQTLKWQ